jgi:hypothetical protein
MSLMKAYETILRSEGILPVSDYKIYNLVFKVFDKCEKTALSQESSFIRQQDTQEEANVLQMSLHEHKETA